MHRRKIGKIGARLLLLALVAAAVLGATEVLWAQDGGGGSGGGGSALIVVIWFVAFVGSQSAQGINALFEDGLVERFGRIRYFERWIKMDFSR